MKRITKMSDVLIPIVFPDYKIMVQTPAAKVKVPDYLPFVDILPNEIRVPHTKNKISDLGHAGVLFINGKTGTTKYFEYGRYDPEKLGWVKKIQNLPNVKVDKNGIVTEQSLINVLMIVSRKAGKLGRISGAYIEVENKYDAMLRFSQNRMALNKKPNRESYDLFSYSCLHFMQGVMKAAGINTPWLLDPRPVSYIEEIQDEFSALEFTPSNNKLKISESSSVFGF